MASSLSRKLLRTMLKNPSSIKASHLSSVSLCSSAADDFSSPDSDHTELGPASDSEPESTVFSSPLASELKQERKFIERPLENGLDVGIYKAIMVGQVGQTPIQKRLKSGRTVTLLSLGTGGIRNNRRPFDNEEPTEYANRCAVQWHRVSVYPERLGEMAMKSIVPGMTLPYRMKNPVASKYATEEQQFFFTAYQLLTSRKKGNQPSKLAHGCSIFLQILPTFDIKEMRNKSSLAHGDGPHSIQHNLFKSSILYVEGNLETKIFTDPITGLVRRIREIAIRKNGRLVFLGKGGSEDQHQSQAEIKRVGYY